MTKKRITFAVLLVLSLFSILDAAAPKLTMQLLSIRHKDTASGIVTTMNGKYKLAMIDNTLYVSLKDLKGITGLNTAYDAKTKQLTFLNAQSKAANTSSNSSAKQDVYKFLNPGFNTNGAEGQMTMFRNKWSPNFPFTVKGTVYNNEASGVMISSASSKAYFSEPEAPWVIIGADNTDYKFSEFSFYTATDDSAKNDFCVALIGKDVNDKFKIIPSSDYSKTIKDNGFTKWTIDTKRYSYVGLIVLPMYNSGEPMLSLEGSQLTATIPSQTFTTGDYTSLETSVVVLGPYAK